MSEITIEADTVESALAEVAERLGPGARILEANRVRRGGLAGFFAREVVEVVAAPAEHPPPSPPGDPAGPAPASSPRGVDGALQRMLDAADEGSFAEVLGRTLVGAVAGPPRTTPAVAAGGFDPVDGTEATPDPARPASVPNPAPRITGVRWDIAQLLEAGLPSALVEPLAELDPADDLAHVTALAHALAPLCGTPPPGPGHLVGPRAERLAAALPDGPSGDWLHVVIGDEGAPAALTATPALVSWVSERGAVAAIRVAQLTGATLGYGMGSGFGAPARRVTALDAAWAIRELMERA